MKRDMGTRPAAIAADRDLPSVTIVESEDAAIALAIAESEPGDLVLIHASDCPIWKLPAPTEADFETCGCMITTLTVGATA